MSLVRKIGTFTVMLLMASSSLASSCEVACATLAGQTGHHSTVTSEHNDQLHTTATVEHHHQASAQDVAVLPSPVSAFRLQPGDCAGAVAQPLQSAMSKPERQDHRAEISVAEDLAGISLAGARSAGTLSHLSRLSSRHITASSPLRI